MENKTWKQVKLFVADTEQSVMIEPTPERDGIVMYIKEEDQEGKTFIIYMSKNEALDLAKEIKEYIHKEL